MWCPNQADFILFESMLVYMCVGPTAVEWRNGYH